MAESEPVGGNNLDDFFAKKDKSKKKTKAKFTVDDILQAKTESDEKSKKGRSKKREKDSSRPDKALGVKAEGDEEWNEVEEETEKDYTGLRIQNLQITSKADDDRQESGLSRNEDGEDGETREAQQGPWKPVPSTSSVVPAVQPTAPPAAVAAAAAAATPEPEPPKSTGKYVPPQMRRTGGETSTVSSSSGGGGRAGRSGKKTAPDVNSQDDFPTLGSVAEPCEGPAFEKIRGGARQMDDPASQHMKLSLGNKFGALNDDDS